MTTAQPRARWRLAAAQAESVPGDAAEVARVPAANPIALDRVASLGDLRKPAVGVR